MDVGFMFNTRNGGVYILRWMATAIVFCSDRDNLVAPAFLDTLIKAGCVTRAAASRLGSGLFGETVSTAWLAGVGPHRTSKSSGCRSSQMDNRTAESKMSVKFLVLRASSCCGSDHSEKVCENCAADSFVALIVLAGIDCGFAWYDCASVFRRVDIAVVQVGGQRDVRYGVGFVGGV